MQSGSTGTAATRVLALLVESGVVYIFLWVCFYLMFNNLIAMLIKPQVLYVISCLDKAPRFLDAGAHIADITSTILVCSLPLTL